MMKNSCQRHTLFMSFIIPVFVVSIVLICVSPCPHSCAALLHFKSENHCDLWYNSKCEMSLLMHRSKSSRSVSCLHWPVEDVASAVADPANATVLHCWHQVQAQGRGQPTPASADAHSQHHALRLSTRSYHEQTNYAIILTFTSQTRCGTH